MDATLLERELVIAAPPRRVWPVVSDIRRMPEWSPQAVSTRLRAGFERVEAGTRFTNRNSHGEMEWITHGEIVRFEVDREIAFRIEENWVIWSFLLEPHEEGTTLVQRREAPEGISPFSRELTETYMGGRETFDALMSEGMSQTLAGIAGAVLDPR